jgi:ring-1,2-phenylacetyl-CoA epoxidase subunit PaaD
MSASITARRPTLEQLWAWLSEVPDPEIPAVSVVDLGVVRDVAWSGEHSDLCLVTVTPTYTGCPATAVISEHIREHLASHGVTRVQLDIRLSPSWTTDWLTPKARQDLHDFGIAPPVGSVTLTGESHKNFVVLGQECLPQVVSCPRCGSEHTELISQFGSTPCKALYRCTDCLEPFDHFKCH